MTTNGYFFSRDAAGSYRPVELQVRSVTRDGQGNGSVEVTLSTGDKVSLHAELDPGQWIAGATFYATVEPGNRLAPIPWRQVYAEPAHAAVAQDGVDAMRAGVTARVTQMRDLLRTLKAAPVPSPQLLATAKKTLQDLFAPAATGSGVPTKTVNLAAGVQNKRRKRGTNRIWRVELRPAGNLAVAPLAVDAFRDTGADINCISDRAARRLQLPEVGIVDISGITSHPQRLSKILVHVTLPKYGIAREVEAAVIPDLKDRCGQEFLISNELNEAVEETLGVA